MLDGGRIVAEGTADELKRAGRRARLDLQLADADALRASCTTTSATRASHSDRATLTIGVATDGGAADVAGAARRTRPRAGSRSPASRSARASLDDVFMTLTGDHTHDPRHDESEIAHV